MLLSIDCQMAIRVEWPLVLVLLGMLQRGVWRPLVPLPLLSHRVHGLDPA